jgi:thioredoxin reductase (NADPH)
VYNYPGFPDGIDGPELMLRIKKQCQNQGVEILPKTVDRVDFTVRPFKVFA